MVSLDALREQLIGSKLMTPAAVDRHLADWRRETGAPASAPAEQFAAWLEARQLLSHFEAEALRGGHGCPFMVGPFRVLSQMAAGRLGNVYRAVYEQYDQPVSLKIFPSSLKDDPEKVARMRREFRVNVELEHPNIVRAFQIGREGDIYYLVFEALEGETLSDRLNREGALDYPTACRLMRHAALGLVYLHEKGLVHRDINPGNMWLSDGSLLKLMEFAAVRDALGAFEAMADEMTTSDTVLGSLQYAAPEQTKDPHAADHRSDIYALGCTLYHCLTGRTPFPDVNPIRLAARHASEMPTPIATLVPAAPSRLSDVVNAMMANRPEDRYQDTQDVVWALEQYLEPADLAAPAPSGPASEGLQWLRSIKEGASASRSPELAEFLHWLAHKDAAD